MKTKHIIIGLIIVLVVLFFVQKKEHAGSTQPLSNEAIQNIAKVYADTTGTVTFNNIKTNGESTFGGMTSFKGNSSGPTHFPFADGKNYIRGDTQIDGATTVNGLIKMNNGFTALSPNKQYELKIGDDGNLVISKSDGSVLWDSFNTAKINKKYKITGGNNQTVTVMPPGFMGYSDIKGSSIDLGGSNPSKEFYLKPI